MFADDINIYASSRNINTLNNKINLSLKHLVKDMNKLKLEINIWKLYYINFNGRSTYLKKEKTKIKIRYTILAQKTDGKFLGITFDNKLENKLLHSQIKTQKNTSTMNHHQTPLSTSSTNFIRPIFEYGSTATIISKHLNIWDSNQATYYKKSLTFQAPHRTNWH